MRWQSLKCPTVRVCFSSVWTYGMAHRTILHSRAFGETAWPAPLLHPAPETTLWWQSCESLTSHPYIQQLPQEHFSQQLWLRIHYYFCYLFFLPPFHWEIDSVSNCAFSGTANLNSSIVSLRPCVWAPAPICVAKPSHQLQKESGAAVS